MFSFKDKRSWGRVLMSCTGVLLGGVSVGMCRTAALGVDPFQSFMSGLSSLVPISFGTLYVIANAVLLAFSLIFDRHKIGLATLINLTLLGYAAEYSELFFSHLFPTLGFAPAFLLFAFAIVIMCFGSALYFNADLGVSTYDAVALVISEKQSRVPFRFCRIISDLVCVTVGVSLYLLSGSPASGLGSVVGIGTVVTAFFMGPLISFFSRRLPFSKDPVSKKPAAETARDEA